MVTAPRSAEGANLAGAREGPLPHHRCPPGRPPVLAGSSRRCPTPEPRCPTPERPRQSSGGLQPPHSAPCGGLPPCPERVGCLPLHPPRRRSFPVENLSSGHCVGNLGRPATCRRDGPTKVVRGWERRIPALERGGRPSGPAFVCATIKANSAVLPRPLGARGHLCRALCAPVAASSAARQRWRVQRHRPTAKPLCAANLPSGAALASRAEPCRAWQRGAPWLPTAHTQLCRCRSQPHTAAPGPPWPLGKARSWGFSFGSCSSIPVELPAELCILSLCASIRHQHQPCIHLQA